MKRIITLVAWLSLCACSCFGQGLIVQYQNGGTVLGTFKKWLPINCSTNLTCTFTNGVIVMSASGGSAAAGGSNTQIQWNNATALGGISSWTTNGTTTITGASTGVLDLSAMSVTAGLKFPSAAGAAPTADSFPAFNTTNHTLVWGSNGTTIVGAAAATGTGTNTTCSNQFVTAVSALAAPTCTTDTLASAQHANQGTTTTVLHGNAAGNPSFGQVNFASDVTGTIQATNFPTLAGDVTTPGSSLTTTVVKLNGNSVPTGAAAHQVLDCTSASTCVWKTVPDCNGSSNALNYTQSTDVWSCLSISTLSNPMTTLGDVLYGGASGAATRLAGPTSAGTYFLQSKPSAGAATAPTFSLAGVIPNPQTGTTYTYLATDATSDRAGYTSFSNASAIAVTLPQAGSAGFGSNWVNVSCDIGAGTATITPTTSTISYSNGSTYTSAASSMALTTGQCAWIYSDNTNYFAIKFAAGGSGAPGGVTLLAKTASYAGVSGDFSSSSAAPTQIVFTLVATGQSYTLPSSAPSSGACVILEDSLASAPFMLGIITGGSTTLDGTAYTTAATTLQVGPGSSTEICSNGTNYFSLNGRGHPFMSTTGTGGVVIPEGIPGTATTGNFTGANTSQAAMFVLHETVLVTKMSGFVGTGSASATCDWGVYDSSGNLLTHTGSQGCGSGVTGTVIVATPASAVVLAPGTYYAAACSSVGAVTIGVVAFANEGYALLASTGTNAHVAGTGATACTAGVLPASLGAVTNNASIAVPSIGLIP